MPGLRRLAPGPLPALVPRSVADHRAPLRRDPHDGRRERARRAQPRRPARDLHVHLRGHDGPARRGRRAAPRLYDRAKRRQWDAAERIDWSQPLDPESPDELPDSGVPLFGSPIWARMSPGERDQLRHHFQAWQLSQYMHGEQGALLAASKLVQQLPGSEGKLYAATQVMDEARHLEAFTRLLQDKFALSYGVNRPLERLLGDVLSDSRWDMTCLGMQVLIEGLALAAFATMRQQSSNPLMEQVNAAVMEDEARHMAFGRMLLEAHYRELSDAEKREREEFVVEACYALRDRFRAEAVWERLGLPVDACAAWMDEGGTMRRYRAELFSRVAPTVRAIGLMGPRVERAFADMGVLRFADAARSEAVMAEDRATLASFTPFAAEAAPQHRGA
ncbi:MAG: ferritin-like domain-containing protein [Alphaproteobacteria bacterium]|nr:ferritin-like domain-containing protein [Alphaproteobacteria bacterium]